MLGARLVGHQKLRHGGGIVHREKIPREGREGAWYPITPEQARRAIGPEKGAGHTFCLSRRTPLAAGTDMFVAVLPLRILITVPSRMTRILSSSARLRAHPASKSTLTLRQA